MPFQKFKAFSLRRDRICVSRLPLANSLLSTEVLLCVECGHLSVPPGPV